MKNPLNGYLIPVGMTGIIITSLIGYGELKQQNLRNTKDIEQLLITPINVAKIEVKLENVQRVMEEQNRKLDLILNKLVRE